MKICFFINGFGSGGAERQCAYLINELQKDLNFEISLLYFFEGENFELLNREGVIIHKIASDSQYNLSNISKINKIIKVLNPDILFSWMRGPDILSFFVKCRFPNLKWIIAERNSNYHPWWNYRFILRVLFGRYSNLIICNSIGGKIYWKKKLVNDKSIKIIPNILYHQSNKNIVPIKVAGNPVVVFAGRLMYQKNVISITLAFCRLSKEIPSSIFYIIGEGDKKEEIESIIKMNGAEKNVLLLPYQDNVLSYFTSLDVFVNVSLYEGLPNTIIENIILDNKIVLSRIPEHTSILGENYPFYVSDLQSIDEICKIIKLALEDGIGNKYLDSGKEFVQSLNVQNVIGEYKKSFNAIIK